MATTNKRFVAKNGLDNNNQTITNIGAAGTSLGLSGTGDLTIAVSGTATLTIPAGSDTLVTLSGAQTLTNKTISGSNNTLSNIGNGSLTNSSVSFNGVSVALGASGTLYTDDISEDGSPTNKYFTDARARAAISVTDSGGDGSLSYDSGTGVITYTGPSATEVRAHLSAGTGLTYTTGQFAIDNTVVTLTGTQTLENKTLTTPVISAITNTGTLTLPTSTDTLVGRATTDTLSNKTISGASNTISNIGNGSLTNSSITINGTSVSLGGTRTLVTDDIAEDGSPVNLWYTDTRARNAISVTDAGGDGSLSYSSGVITYTGPSASEVRAHFSAGTGVTITSGQVAIGQAVATTDNVTFAGVTADNVRVGVTAAGEIDTSTGNLTIDSAGGTTTIDDDATVTGNLQVDGNLTVSGTTVTVNATNLAIEDNMIYLNNGSTVSHPDLGFAGNYNDGTYRHAGLFRDATDGVWKFFHQYTPEPDASAYIDTSHGSFALAPVQASSFTGSVTGNASTATTWQTARTLSLTGDVTGTSAAFDGSGNISISTTIAADSVALGTDTTGNYVASITNGNYITGGNGGSEGAALTLAVDATSANTASKVVARDASGNFSAGTITAALSGNASTVTNGVYTTDTGTVTNTMLAGSIANNKLANSTISGISLGGNLATLTLDVSGTGLSGSQTYNGSGAATFTVTSNATSANTASTIVARDASGNFTAGTITAALSGNATSATNSTTTSQRAFSSDISTTGQGRFTGWYTGNAATGLAAEIGVSGGEGYVITYNRDTSSYGTTNIQSGDARIKVGSAVNVDIGALQQGGNQVLHAGNYTSYPTSWSGIPSGYRENYDLGFRPADNSGSYSGFRFASPGNDANAGYLLIRGGANNDVYTQNGITIVADLGWLTLAQRTTASRGVRIMSGSSTSTERLLVTTAGDIQFVNGNSFTYGGNAILHAGNYNSYSPTLTGTGASGTWGISISGNAATATSATSASSASEATYAFRLFSADLRTIAPNSHTAYRATFGFTSWANNNSAPYADYIHLRSYSDSSGGSDNLIMFLKSGIGMRIWQQSFNSGTAYSSYVDVLHSGNYGSYALPLSGGTLTGVVRLNSSAYFTADGTYGYRFNSSTDAFNNVIFYDNGNVYIRTSLGVGTSTPTFALSVAGTIQSIGAGTDSVAGGPASVYLGDGSAGTMLRHTASRHFAIDTYSSGSTWIERIRVERDGNVGIGTSSPSTLLHVKASGNYGTIVSDNSTNTGGGAFGVRKNGSAIGFLLNKGSWYGDTSNDLCVAAETGYNFRIYTNGSASEKFIFTAGGSLGIGTTSPATTLDVRGGILRTNSRVGSDQNYPLGHYTPGETVFEIDPTWSQSELQEFFGSSGVSWVADSTAPGGYAIQVSGYVAVGGVYNSGFPYIPVDQDDVFMMECWIKDVSGTNAHYMGSIDFNASFSSLGGNPGSFGYWVMSGSYPGSSWTRVSGYISGFGGSTGQFVSGTKYWTPQALFNYVGAGTSYISGWKAIKVSHRGNHRFLNNVGIGGGHAPDVALSVNGVVHIGNGGNFVYMGGTAGSVSSWGSRHYTSGGNNVNNANSFQFDNVGYGGTWTVTFNSSGITASGNITAYSDIRLKENIMKIENALDKVQQLRGITYTRNDTDDTTKRHAGVIAQEVEQVLPEVVDETSSGIKHVAYGNMIGLLIEAIKELKHDNEQLHKRIQQWEDNS